MKSLFMLLFFNLTITFVRAQSAQDFYREGNELLKNKQTEAAVGKYSRALELDSNLSAANMNRAKAYMDLKKWSDAIKDFDRVIAKDPKNCDALLGRGKSKFEINYSESAILDYSNALEINEKQTAVLYNRGIALYKVNRYGESLRDFEKLLELLETSLDNETDKFPDIMLNIGNCFRMLTNNEKAISSYEKALEKSPNNAEIYFGRASVKFADKKWGDAILDYSKATQLNPNFTNAFYYRGMAYRELKKYKEALLDFDKVIKLEPKLTLGYISRAYTYADLAKYKEALRDYDMVLNELAPDDAATYIRRGYVYIESAQYDKAVSDFSKTIALSELDNAISSKGWSMIRKGVIPDLLPSDLLQRSWVFDRDTDISKTALDVFGSCFDLFGDGSIRLVELPGHHTGQFGAILKKENGEIIFLCADACWLSDSYRENRLPPSLAKLLISDWKSYKNTIGLLHNFHKKFPEIAIIPTHCRKTHEALELYAK